MSEKPIDYKWLRAYDAFLNSARAKEMAIIAKCDDKNFKPVPAGAHPAICIWMVDLGLQSGPYKTRHQVYMKFEIPGERMKVERDGVEVDMPMTIGAYYTVSLSRKSNLRSDLEGWRGVPFTEQEAKGFDITKVLGKHCTVVVQHKINDDHSRTAVVKSITQAPRGWRPAPENDLILVDDEHQDLDALPEWLRDQVLGQVPPQDEDPGDVGGTDLEPLDDDIPF